MQNVIRLMVYEDITITVSRVYQHIPEGIKYKTVLRVKEIFSQFRQNQYKTFFESFQCSETFRKKENKTFDESI